MSQTNVSPAEERVLKLVMKGKTNEKLAIGVPTVKAHIMSLFRKLKVTNRVLLVLKGQKLGI